MAIRKRRRHPVKEDVPASGVFVLESHHAVDFKMDRRRHTFLKVLYIKAGTGRLITDQRTLRCEAGDVLVVPIGQYHRIEDDPDQPISLYALCVEPRIWRQEPGLDAMVPTGRLPRNGVIASQVRISLRRLLYEQTLPRSASSAMIVGMALQLLAALARVAGQRGGRSKTSLGNTTQASTLQRRVEAYVNDLDRRFFEVRSLDVTITELGMSRRRFTQLFRKITGESWLGYIQKLRIAHAKRLLRRTDRTITSIAFECGFDDLSTFYRAFNRYTNVSPLQWRRGAVPASEQSQQA